MHACGAEGCRAGRTRREVGLSKSVTAGVRRLWWIGAVLARGSRSRALFGSHAVASGLSLMVPRVLSASPRTASVLSRYVSRLAFSRARSTA